MGEGQPTYAANIMVIRSGVTLATAIAVNLRSLNSVFHLLFPICFS